MLAGESGSNAKIFHRRSLIVPRLGDTFEVNPALLSLHCQLAVRSLAMKLLRASFVSSLSLLALAGTSLPAVAAKIPANLNDNVVTCGANARCSNKVMFGRNYKVIETAKFTVMVSLSNEAAYTRADVSIENHAGYSQKISPEDFRVEVLSPKPKILLYIPPTELHNLPVPPPVVIPKVAAAPTPTAAATVQVASLGGVVPVPEATSTAPSIDELYLAAKREAAIKEAAEREAAQKHLEPVAIPANETVRGRVYFEKYPKAKEANIVLPIAGLVFEFPYTMKF